MYHALYVPYIFISIIKKEECVSILLPATSYFKLKLLLYIDRKVFPTLLCTFQVCHVFIIDLPQWIHGARVFTLIFNIYLRYIVLRKRTLSILLLVSRVEKYSEHFLQNIIFAIR